MSNGKQKSFMIYKDNRILFDRQSDESAGKLIKAIFAYTCDGAILETSDDLLGVSFEMIKNNLDRDAQKYEETCARNSENQKKRWLKNDTSYTTVYDRIAPYTNDTDIDIDKDTDRDKDTDKELYTLQNLRKINADNHIGLNDVGLAKFAGSMRDAGWKVYGKPIENIGAVMRNWARDAPDIFKQ